MPFVNDQIVNMMKMHAASQMQSYAFSRLAWVKDYDPETNCFKVGYYNPVSQEFDLMSGWLPHIVPALGKGDDSEGEGGESWGFQHPPNINEQVVVISHNGDFSDGMILGAHYSDKVPPPNPDGDFVEMGEFLWCHKTQSYLKFLNNGDVTLVTDNDLNVHVKHDGRVQIEGDLTLVVKGNATTFVEGNATTTVKGDMDVLVGGSLTASAAGSIDIETEGNATVNANGAVSVTSRLGALTLDALANVSIISRLGNIELIAAGTIIPIEGAVLPPLPPVILRPIGSSPELFGGATPTPTPPGTPAPTPAPPAGGPPVAQGNAPGVGNVTGGNSTPNSVGIQFNAPVGSGANLLIGTPSIILTNAESAQGTIVAAVGMSIIDSFGNTWTLGPTP